MFEVLTFVYENYDPGEACPEPAHLERKLTAVGFESDEIGEALTWLKGLEGAAHPTPLSPWLVQPQSASMRIYPRHEQSHLGTQALGFLSFLESAAQMPAQLREVVIERAMAAPGGPVSLDDLKIIVLMVYWRFGQEPNALVLDELCDDSSFERVMH
jgi:Smg protein